MVPIRRSVSRIKVGADRSATQRALARTFASTSRANIQPLDSNAVYYRTSIVSFGLIDGLKPGR